MNHTIVHSSGYFASQSKDEQAIHCCNRREVSVISPINIDRFVWIDWMVFLTVVTAHNSLNSSQSSGTEITVVLFIEPHIAAIMALTIPACPVCIRYSYFYVQMQESKCYRLLSCLGLLSCILFSSPDFAILQWTLPYVSVIAIWVRYLINNITVPRRWIKWWIRSLHLFVFRLWREIR